MGRWEGRARRMIVCRRDRRPRVAPAYVFDIVESWARNPGDRPGAAEEDEEDEDGDGEEWVRSRRGSQREWGDGCGEREETRKRETTPNAHPPHCQHLSRGPGSVRVWCGVVQRGRAASCDSCDVATASAWSFIERSFSPGHSHLPSPPPSSCRSMVRVHAPHESDPVTPSADLFFPAL